MLRCECKHYFQLSVSVSLTFGSFSSVIRKESTSILHHSFLMLTSLIRHLLLYATLYKIVNCGKGFESGNVGSILFKLEIGNKKMEISTC